MTSYGSAPAMAESRWNLTTIREVKRIGRDLLCYGLAAFMVIYATLHAVEFGVGLVTVLVGTASVFLGLPHVLRLDSRESEERP